MKDTVRLARIQPIGIAIGERYIHAAQLKPRRGGFNLRGLWVRALPPQEPEPAADSGTMLALFKQLARHKRFKGRRVVVSLPASKENSFPIRFKIRTRESLEEAILRQSTEHLTFPLAEAIVDYTSLEKLDDEQEPEYKATIVATQRDTVQHYLRLLKAARLSTEVVDFGISALIRLHQQIFAPSPNATVLCNIDQSQTQVTVFTADRILGQRNIAWGIDILFTKIADHLPHLADPGQSAIVLQSHGLHYEAHTRQSAGDKQKLDPDTLSLRRILFQILTPYIDELIFEFHKLISYIRAAEQQTFMEGIYIYGPAAAIAGLDSYFERRLNMTARCVNPLATPALGPAGPATDTTPADMETSAYATALGLALRRVAWF